MSNKSNDEYVASFPGVEREYVAPSPRHKVTVMVNGETYVYTVVGSLIVSEWEVRIGDRTIFLSKNVLKIERA